MPKKLIPYPFPKKASTLVEILVVIGIIVILSALVITALNPAQLRRAARDSNRQKDLAVISSALEQYYADNNSYPTGISNIGELQELLSDEKYIRSFPLTQSEGQPMEYCYTSSTGQDFAVCAPLEATTEALYENGTPVAECNPGNPGGVVAVYGKYCIANPF